MPKHIELNKPMPSKFIINWLYFFTPWYIKVIIQDNGLEFKNNLLVYIKSTIISKVTTPYSNRLKKFSLHSNRIYTIIYRKNQFKNETTAIN